MKMISKGLLIVIAFSALATASAMAGSTVCRKMGNAVYCNSY